MDTRELITCLLMNLACMAKNCSFTTWMPGQNARCVIHLSVDDDPAVIFLVMLLYLLPRKLLLRDPGLLSGILDLILCTWFHPSALTRSWLHWMLK